MRTRYIGALDQGTTSTRFLLFDHDGRIAGSHQLEHEQIYPRPGWVEHDPLELWQRTREVITGALRSAAIGPEAIEAVGVTNQRETTIVWNRSTGRPYHNAVVWQDTRTREICNALAGEIGPSEREKTGLPVSTYFSATKLKWLLDNVDGLRSAAERGEAAFGTVDSWLLWWLTGGPDHGVHVTDVTNASRTWLMDLSSLCWDDELLRLFDIPPRLLPEIRPSVEPGAYGSTTEDGPFGRCIPVAGALGDQQAALFGQSCFDPGETKNTYGTGCFLLSNTGRSPVASQHGLLTTVAYRIADAPAVYALEGAVAVAGALVQWIRDNLGLIGSSPEIERLASGAVDNGGVCFVPAFSGLFAPYWRSEARGLVIGLTHSTNRSHIARAALEATAFQTRDICRAMEDDTGRSVPVLKADGGMVANDLLMQFQADILDTPVEVPAVSETTALGACYAAGLATGFWSGTDELKRHWTADRRFESRMDEATRTELCGRWERAVRRSFDWLQPEPLQPEPL